MKKLIGIGLVFAIGFGAGWYGNTAEGKQQAHIAAQKAAVSAQQGLASVQERLAQ